MKQQPEAYDIVVSLAGHDRGKLFMVTGRSGERLLLCDGKNRRMEDPKSKSPKHVRVVARGGKAPATDREIRQTLAQAACGAEAKEGELLGER